MALGATDRIDLQCYFPFLACVSHSCHMHPEISTHPALTHKILNSPNPNSGEIVKFPNGVEAKMVLLGERFPNWQMDMASERWWPSGLDAKVRHKLMRRIFEEGNVLPTALAICTALLSEMYTTTAIPTSETPKWQATGRRRVRLSYNRSPIADFGIVRGSVRVTPQDRLAYYHLEKNTFMMGQDPDDHYWIYFTTLAGEEYFLDCGMMTFNFCEMFPAEPYCRFGLPPIEYAPAFFYGKERAKALPLITRIGWKPRQRFSILREKRLAGMLASFEFDYCDCHDIPTVNTILDEIAGRECSQEEKKLTMIFIANACKVLRLNMQNREYLNFPKEPQLNVEIDPEEKGITIEDEEDRAYSRYIQKWSRKLKKGKASPDQWLAAFNAWKDKPYEARMRMADKAK